MGGSSYSDAHYYAKTSARAAAGIPTFSHDADVRSGKANAIHDKLNPKGVKVRECRDSDAHPNSLAIMFFLDVTGSMNEVPKIVQSKLPTLMGMLLRKGLVDPAILAGGVGDATCDRAPLQAGQFESGVEIDDDITNLYLEGGGGGQMTESYELAMYFAARHTSIDCYEKRGKKGYFFITGDELPYSKVSASLVKEFIGDDLDEDIPLSQIVKELQERYHVFYIMPNLSSYYGSTRVLGPWRDLLGERVLLLDDPNSICELVASTIAVMEGENMDGIVADMKSAGANAGTVVAVSKSLDALAKNAPATSITVDPSSAASGLVSI